jgi:hypothetical protein
LDEKTFGGARRGKRGWGAAGKSHRFQDREAQRPGQAMPVASQAEAMR